MQLIPWSVAQCIPIKCSGFYAAWPKASRLKVVHSMQHHWMQWIPCSMVKCIPIKRSGLHAAWLNGSRVNAVDSMQCHWMQWIPCSMVKCIPIDAVDSMHYDWMQWKPRSMVKCIPIERSAFHAAGLNGSRLNAVDSMQRGPMDLERMQWIPCSVVQWI